MKKTIIIVILLSALEMNAQIGGRGIFSFTNLPFNSKMQALGTNFISDLNSNDNSLSWNNPAMLNKNMDNALSFSYNNFINDIKFGTIAYAKSFKNIGTFNIGIMYLDYGKFDGYDAAGIATRNFTVKDQCLSLGWGKAINSKLNHGVNLKAIYSIYEAYVGNGIALDYSIQYHDTAKLYNISGFVRNLGYQLYTFGETNRQPLATEIAITLSKKLRHLPFTYYLTAHNLQTPDFRYTISETGQRDENGNNKVKKMTMGDNILRHLNFGGEFNLSKKLALRMGYNHNRRKEMFQEVRRGTTGFSWGLAIKLNKYHFAYSSSAYFPGQNQNQFSLLVNLNDFKKN